MILAENPAFCNRYAIRSRKLTNWLKTIDFVVASLRRKLLNSSTRASILVEDRQAPRSNLPSIPCLAVRIFSSNSRAGASRSIVSATWHTGQSGCQKCAWGLVYNRLESSRTESSIEEVKYCRMHSLSKMWRHLDWIASSAKSLHSRQMVASTSMGTNEVAVVLLRSTRSGWQANCLILVRLS